MLQSFLAPGGSLLIVDFIKSDVPSIFKEKLGHINAHSGFQEPEMRAMLERAGLGGFEFKPMGEAVIKEVPMKFFVARGVKA